MLHKLFKDKRSIGEVKMDSKKEMWTEHCETMKNEIRKAKADTKFKVEDYIRIVPNFPKKGIMFKDISPLLASPEAFRNMINQFAYEIMDKKVDKIVAIDSRGFIFGSALASKLGIGLILARKAGKLPPETISETYKLEYGEATLEMLKDSIQEGDNIVIIDDVLATGGTIEAAVSMVKKLKGNIVKVLFLIELGFLNGKSRLDVPYASLCYEE